MLAGEKLQYSIMIGSYNEKLQYSIMIGSYMFEPLKSASIVIWLVLICFSLWKAAYQCIFPTQSAAISDPSDANEMARVSSLQAQAAQLRMEGMLEDQGLYVYIYLYITYIYIYIIYMHIILNCVCYDDKPIKTVEKL